MRKVRLEGTHSAVCGNYTSLNWDVSVKLWGSWDQHTKAGLR